MNAKLRSLFEDYETYHRHPINRLTHKIAIPLIVFHIIAMLNWVSLFELALVPGGQLTLAHLGVAAVVAWYLTLDSKLALFMAVFFLACFPLAAVTPPVLVVLVAVVGWGIQLAGHMVWEKKQPAFMTNLVQTLVGPLFFMDLLTGQYPGSRN